jgi:hypothetical protein
MSSPCHLRGVSASLVRVAAVGSGGGGMSDVSPMYLRCISVGSPKTRLGVACLVRWRRGRSCHFQHGDDTEMTRRFIGDDTEILLPGQVAAGAKLDAETMDRERKTALRLAEEKVGRGGGGGGRTDGRGDGGNGEGEGEGSAGSPLPPPRFRHYVLLPPAI